MVGGLEGGIRKAAPAKVALKVAGAAVTHGRTHGFGDYIPPRGARKSRRRHTALLNLRIHFFPVVLAACSIDHLTRSPMNFANGSMFIWTLALSSAFM